ncbi:hypothetical protein BAE44_0001875 [Dichanthelium oligosanthes]|uniref:PhoD-like phosphatase metallophosphatase domain-containing protein n=1 Tax=Dichanthelium oligosanthes TaxID=888268 RepID=A0A1E5WIA2_9POAL|nr:hypothetical protein BAE44_0001875 [Dichanthelium oligosanthes]
MAATFPLLLLLLVLSPSARAALDVDAVVSRIAFGSCANQSEPQPIWDAVAGFDPQVFVWLGDNVYGDNKRPFRVFGKERTVGPWKNVPRFYPSTEEELRRRYQLARAQPGYARLRERAQVIGTWDDHDYGLNDAGKEFSGKVFTQRLLLDFLDEAEDSKRYHRDPILSDGTILGDPQWQWLERELHGPQSEITVIGSSIQVVSNLSATTGPLFYVESWARFPRERERLFRLIDSSKRSGVIFLSGDVHFGEIARFDCGAQYPLYDVTSSGLTQSVENSVPAIFQPLMRLLAVLTPTTMRVLSPNCMYKSCTTGQPNFGAIEIDWDAVPARIKLELRDVEGHSVHSVEFPISELRPSVFVIAVVLLAITCLPGPAMSPQEPSGGGGDSSVPWIQLGTIDGWKGKALPIDDSGTEATTAAKASRRQRQRRACWWLPFAFSSSSFPRPPGALLVEAEDPFRSALPSPSERSALNRRLVNDCLEHYNSTHPGDEYEPAPGLLTLYRTFAASGCWTHGTFVAGRKRRLAASFLPPAPRTLFFELLCSEHVDGAATCVPLDEPVTEACCFRGLRIGWGARRDGSADRVCRTCYRRVVDGPCPRPRTKTFACGHAHDGKGGVSM